MPSAIFMSLSLLVICTLVHYEILNGLRTAVQNISIGPRRAKVLLVILGAMGSHIFQIIIFASAYYLLRDKMGLGLFGGDFENTFASFLYFSTETYTSLGLGDIYPVGAIRMLAGIEALTGLVMISWTASFTYLQMARYWKDT